MHISKPTRDVVKRSDTSRSGIFSSILRISILQLDRGREFTYCWEFVTDQDIKELLTDSKPRVVHDVRRSNKEGQGLLARELYAT